MIDKKLKFGFILGSIFIVLGLVLRLIDETFSTLVLGFGLILSSLSFMIFAWSNIRKK